MTLSTLFQAYLSEYLLERSQTSHHTFHSHARVLVSEIGDREIGSIHERDVRFWVAQSRGRLRASSISHRLSFLRSAFEWACKNDLLGVNPVSAVKSLKALNRRHRYLTPEEESRIQLRACPKIFSIVRFALLTGLRRLEIFHLKPEHVDWTRKTVIVADSKTRTQRIIPLHPEAFMVALYWRAVGGAWLFEPSFNPRRRWMAASSWYENRFVPLMKEAEIEDFRFHDLRHTFASRLVERGVPLYTVQLLLGHSDPKMTQRYAHLSADHLREAVYRIN